METRISLLMPTRGRPALARRFLDSVMETAEMPSLVEVVIYSDDDDPESTVIGHPGLKTTHIVGPRLPMGACNTACLAEAKGAVIMLANDDIVCRTRGWDSRLYSVHGHHPDGIYLAYGNDLFKGRSLCAFPILSRHSCELIGNPFPADYKGAFIDYHLLDIFKRVAHRSQERIFYLEDVIFEHMHFRSGKGPLDQTYAARQRFGDDDAFLRLRDARSIAAGVLIQAIKGNSNPPASLSAARRTDPKFGLLRATLFDRELPLRWALRLYIWFLGRFVGWLVAEFRKNVRKQLL